jgi:iron complex outermembrane receptor protein
MFTKLLGNAGFALLLCGTSSAAMAQAATDPAPASPPAAAPSTPGLEEIVVTAQKRSEKLQDVPIAISAFTSQSLATQRISSSQDLSLMSPALNYNSQAGYAVPYLRGIGTDITQPNSDPSVATYLDGVYLANDAGSVVSLLGVDRVEIVEGPQGTLSGRNAVGGAINVITMSPGDKFRGKVEIGGGNRGRFEGNGYIETPVSDDLSVGLYAVGFRHDSYIDHLTPRSDRMVLGLSPSHESLWALRGKFVYNNHSWLKLTGSIEHADSASSDAGVLRNLIPDDPAVQAGGSPLVENYKTTANGAEGVIARSTTAILREEIDLGSVDLLGITAYRKLRVNIAADFDGTSAPLVNLIADKDASDQYSQEIQLLSKPGSRIKWVAGLYGFYEKGAFTPTGAYSSILYAGVFGPGTYAQAIDANVKTVSGAAFAQVTVPIVDKLNLTAGARYSYDHKEYNANTSFVQVVDGRIDYANAFGQTVYSTKYAHWGSFTPKVSLDYKLGGTLLYASYSKGFKSGVFNLASPATPGPVNPEKLDAYEIGTKSTLLHGLARLNLSAYYYNYRDIQVQVNSQQLGGLAIVANAAAAHLYGVEATGEIQATRELKLNGSVAYEHTKYTKFPGFSSYDQNNNYVGETDDVSGNQLVRAPKWVINAGADYTVDLGASQLIFSANYYHNSGFFWEAANKLRQKAYNLVNGTIRYNSPDKSWSVAVWGKNLTGTHYYTTQLLSNFGVVGNDADPRTFGATISKSF